jgi:small subunit ribosomal protein S7
MRHKKTPKRTVAPDMIFNSILVTKFINSVMRDGKKSVAQKVVYNALELIKAKGLNPLETFEKALANIGPKVEVKSRRVGGANYQVPIEVKHERRTSLSVRWLLEATAKRPNKEFHSFAEKLAAEIISAANSEGEAVKKKEVMHRQAEANKAFSHFRF